MGRYREDAWVAVDLETVVEITVGGWPKLLPGKASVVSCKDGDLDAIPFERALTSDDLLAYVRDRLPAAEVPRVVVLGNAGIHTRRVVEAARPALAKLGIHLYYLPPYSPELNRIEQVQHHDMPTRSVTTRTDLRKAVEDGFESYRRRLQAKCDNEPPLAA